MTGFLQALEVQRWDDHRYYHQSRINQSLHLVSPTLTLPSNTPLGKPHGTRHSATTPKSVCI